MTKQRPNLAEIAAAAGSTRRMVEPEPLAATDERAKPGRVGGRRPSTRPTGTKQIAGHFPEEVSWQLRELAAERRTTVQALLGEALNDLFQKHGKPEIAPSKEQ